MALRRSETKKMVLRSIDLTRFNLKYVEIYRIEKVAWWSLSLGPARQLGSGRLKIPARKLQVDSYRLATHRFG